MAYTAWSVVANEQPSTDKWNQLGANDAYLYSELVSINSFVSANIHTGLSTSVLTGSINPTASTSVTGVGTLFTTELNVGDRITVSGETRTVTVITSDTALTVDTAFTDTANDTSVDVLPAISLFRKSDLTNVLTVQDDGKFGFGTPSPSGKYTFVQGNLAYDNGAGFRIQSSETADRTFLFFFTNSTNSTNGIQSYQDGTGAGAKPLYLNQLGGDVVIPTSNLIIGTTAQVSSGALCINANPTTTNAIVISDSRDITNDKSAITNDSGTMKFYTTNAGGIVSGALAMSIDTAQGIVVEKTIYLREQTATPALGSASTVMNIYMKADKFCIGFNDAGTARYLSIPLTGTGTTWTHSTTEP